MSVAEANSQPAEPPARHVDGSQNFRLRSGFLDLNVILESQLSGVGRSIAIEQNGAK
jgi:hypothetical protein